MASNESNSQMKCWRIYYKQDENMHYISPVSVINNLISNEKNVLSVYDLSDGFCWAVWIGRQLRSFASCQGWREVLNKLLDKTHIVSIEYLDAILQLMQSKKLNSVGFYDKAINISFLSGNIWILDAYIHQIETTFHDKIIPNSVYDLIFLFCKQITAVYCIDIWNNIQSTNSSTFSLKCIKSLDSYSEQDVPKAFRPKQWHFIHFKYDHVEYKIQIGDKNPLDFGVDLNNEIMKQFEATYQGVQEYNFPFRLYHRVFNPHNHLGSDGSCRKFNIAQISSLSALLNRTGNEYDDLYPHTQFSHHQEAFVINITFELILTYYSASFMQIDRILKRKPVHVNTTLYAYETLNTIGILNMRFCNEEITMYWEFKDELIGNKCFQYHQNESETCTNKIATILNAWKTNVLFHSVNGNIYVNSHPLYLNEIKNVDLETWDDNYFDIEMGNDKTHNKLTIGDVVKIDIEMCNIHDVGTIINCNVNSDDNEIYYKIRAKHNVYYYLNYHQITNGKLFGHNELQMNNIKINLWNDEHTPHIDPSDTSHPMHIFTLSLFESTKQAMESINTLDNINIKEVQNALKDCGIIYLFYRSVGKYKYIDSDVKCMLDKQEKSDATYIDPLELTNFQNFESKYKMDQLIQQLQNEKVICNIKKSNKEMTYYNLNSLNQNVLNTMSYNKIYFIDIEQQQSLVARPLSDELRTEYLVFGFMKNMIKEYKQQHNIINYETSLNFIIIPYLIDEHLIYTDDDEYSFEDDDDDDDDDDDESWLTFSAGGNEPDYIERNVDENRIISIVSSFKFVIKYECEMCSNYCLSKHYAICPTICIKELMEKYNINNERLLKYFHDKGVYNLFDLNNEYVINPLIFELNTNNKSLYILLIAFLEKINNDDKIQQLNNANYIHVNGLKITQEALSLQNELLINCMHYAKNTLIITYNPYQSTIITKSNAMNIYHPVDIYSNAYSSSSNYFVSKYDTKKIWNEWMKPPIHPQSLDESFSIMESFETQSGTYNPNHNLIESLSLMCRPNTNCNILLITSSLCLNREFIATLTIVPSYHEAISNYRTTFLHRGIIYFWDNIEEKELNETDAIETLITKIRDNIAGTFMESRYLEHIYENKKIAIDIGNRHPLAKQFNYVTIRWLNIGNGACFLYEENGTASQLGLTSNKVFDRTALDDQLRETMIKYGIDCIVPYNIGYYDKEKHFCSLCKQFIIDKSDIGNDKCSHIFCRKCIEQWYEMKDQPMSMRMAEMEPNAKTLRLNCPFYDECKCSIVTIRSLHVEKNDGYSNIPLIIKNQLEKQNNERYDKGHGMLQYIIQHEKMLQQMEQENITVPKN